MVKRNDEQKVVITEGLRGGPGSILLKHFIDSPEELCGKGRVFAYSRLEKGCGVGYHVHEGDGEFYYILSGEGEFNDNGTITTVRAGDLTWTPSGQGHAITNHSDTPLESIALIVYE